MKTENPLHSAEFRTSPLLLAAGFRHAFFTRNGGVSSGPFRSLNFSVTVGDEPANVAENLARAATALGVDDRRIYFASQVHGRDARVVEGSEDRAEVVRWEADALVGKTGGTAIAVRIADCVPILVADTVSGAVVAIHAGWKGLVRGVIEAGVLRLREVAGGTPALVAAIGPHITTPAFEVSEDVAAELASASRGCPVVARDFGAKPHVDLAAVARSQLAALGIAGTAVDLVPGCTAGEPEAWFSFRRDGRRSGRHLAAIVPRS